MYISPWLIPVFAQIIFKSLHACAASAGELALGVGPGDGARASGARHAAVPQVLPGRPERNVNIWCRKVAKCICRCVCVHIRNTDTVTLTGSL